MDGGTLVTVPTFACLNWTEKSDAVSPALAGEVRERIAKALQDATDDTDGWITRLSDEQALALADAVLNGEGER